MQYLDKQQKQRFRDLIHAAACPGAELPADEAGYSAERIGPGAGVFRRIARMATDPAWNLPPVVTPPSRRVWPPPSS